jgi:hypothetical protein
MLQIGNYYEKKLFDNFRLGHFMRDRKFCFHKIGRSRAVKYIPGWMDVEAILRVAYSNQK